MVFSEKTFQISIAVSLIIHTTIFIELPPVVLFHSQQNKNQVEVNYIKEKIESVALKLSTERLTNKQNQRTYSKNVAPPPYVKKEQIFSKVDNIYISESKLLEPEIIAVKKKISLTESQDQELANPVYLNYYQTIRERIRQAAYENFTRLINGEVYLSFMIFNDGKLKDVIINDEKSTTNPYLKNIAEKTVHDASPFPNFPKDLNYPELSFNVIISFEVE